MSRTKINQDDFNPVDNLQFSVSPAAAGDSILINYRILAGTTSATTFRLRAGMATAGTLTINGQGGSRLFGGVLISSMKITEVTP